VPKTRTRTEVFCFWFFFFFATGTDSSISRFRFLGFLILISPFFLKPLATLERAHKNVEIASNTCVKLEFSFCTPKSEGKSSHLIQTISMSIIIMMLLLFLCNIKVMLKGGYDMIPTSKMLIHYVIESCAQYVFN
jgi:hypothetical protein